MYLNTEPRMKQVVELANEFRKATGHDLVICGGFPRDVYFNKEHRDIDIYLNCAHLEAYSKYFWGVDRPWEWDINTKQRGEGEYDHQYIQWCSELRPVARVASRYPLLFGNGQKVNLIALRNDTEVSDVYEPDDIITQFNIGMSQIGVKISDVGVQVHTTSAFWYDANNRRITVLRTGWGHVKTAEGMRKYSVKFPEYKQYLGDIGRYDEKEFLSREYM